MGRLLTAALPCLVVAGVVFGVGMSAPPAQESVDSQETPQPTASAPVWRSFRGDPAQTGVAPGTVSDELEILWTYNADTAVTSTPAIAEGRVFFGADDGMVRSVWLANGDLDWEFQTADMIEAPPLVIDGRVYIGSSDAWFYCLDVETGEEVWKRQGGDRFLGGANWTMGPEGRRWIVAGCYDYNLYCWDAETGEPQWSLPTDNYVNGTPAVGDGGVVFGGCDMILRVVSTSDGSVTKALELGDSANVAGSVALADGFAYFGHYGNEFVCVDLEKEEIVWSYPGRQAFFSSPALTEDLVVFGGRDRQLHCAARDTGEPLWTFPTRKKVDASPVICGDRVIIGSADGRLYVLRLDDGSPVFSYDVGSSIYTSPAVAGGRIAVGCHDGSVHLFGPAEEDTDG